MLGSHRRRQGQIPLVACFLALLTVACGGDDGGAVAQSRVEKFQQCNLLTSGRLSTAITATEGDTLLARQRQACELACVLAATCEQLTSSVCTHSGAAWACISSCSNSFGCADGKSIRAEQRCDAHVDCADLSDERDCAEEAFACGDGQTVSRERLCDGTSHCDNNADEISCPGFSCGDGETIPALWECDGTGDCTDSSDELGCAQFVCP